MKLKGIGEVLSRRLIETGYDTINKVAAGEYKGLERVLWMNPHQVRSVATQAGKMTGKAGSHGRSAGATCRVMPWGVDFP